MSSSDRDWSVLRNLAEKAQQGPWEFDSTYVTPVGDEKYAVTVARCHSTATGEFIAAASPGIVKELIEENEKLRAKLDHAYRVIEQYKQPPDDEKLAKLHERAQRGIRSKAWRVVRSLIHQIRVVQAERDAALAVIAATEPTDQQVEAALAVVLSYPVYPDCITFKPGEWGSPEAEANIIAGVEHRNRVMTREVLRAALAAAVVPEEVKS